MKAKVPTLDVLRNSPLLVCSFAEMLYITSLKQKLQLEQVFEEIEQLRHDDIDKIHKVYKSLIANLITINENIYECQPNKSAINNCIEANIVSLIISDQRFFTDFIRSNTLQEQDRTKHLPKDIENQIELLLKLSLTCLYLLLLHMTQDPQMFTLHTQDCQLEETLLKLISYSIEYQFIPIKKVIMILWLVLHVQFVKNKDEKFTNFQMTLEVVRKTMEQPPRLYQKSKNTVEDFYKRMITNQEQSPLGQVIIVGLLRGLLTTCASSSRSSENDVPGVDVHLEWEQYYLLLKDTQFKHKTSLEIMEQFRLYQEKKPQTFIANEQDRQRVTTCYMICDLLLMLLRGFKRNCVIQTLYFISLITDANGIKVFFKFLLDQYSVQSKQIETYKCEKSTYPMILQSALHKVLKLMFVTCNNNPESIKEYLLKYNAYLTIKKLPQLYEDVKIKKYSYLLLKIQIALIPKQQRSKGNNMKMITEAYCKYVEHKVRPVDSSHQEQLRCLHLLEKNKDQRNDPIYQNEDLRKIYSEYNRYHYWKPPQIQEEDLAEKLLARYKNKNYMDSLLNPEIPQGFEQNYEVWLENNVWDYYD